MSGNKLRLTRGPDGWVLDIKNANGLDLTVWLTHEEAHNLFKAAFEAGLAKGWGGAE